MQNRSENAAKLDVNESVVEIVGEVISAQKSLLCVPGPWGFLTSKHVRENIIVNSLDKLLRFCQVCNPELVPHLYCRVNKQAIVRANLFKIFGDVCFQEISSELAIFRSFGH